MKNPLIAVLGLAAVISFLADKMIDAAVIIAVICINTALGFFKEYKAEEAILALRSQASAEARVLRDCPEAGICQETRIKSQEVVPGDIILLEAGAKVPADSRIIEQANLEVDESMLTGESVPARKTADTLEGDLFIAERDNIIFAGTVVTSGRCKAAVFATGMKSEMGKIARQITKTEKAKTPLKRRTLDLSKKLMILALFASSLTLVVGLWRGLRTDRAVSFYTGHGRLSHPRGPSRSHNRHFSGGSQPHGQAATPSSADLMLWRRWGRSPRFALIRPGL